MLSKPFALNNKNYILTLKTFIIQEKVALNKTSCLE